MTNGFIGLTMLVTLSSPPGAQLRGIVQGIEPGKSLTLRNVVCPANGKYVPEFTINAAEIVELVEAINENAPPPAPPPIPQSTTIATPENFEDPAILSMGKRPIPDSGRPAVPTQWSSTPMQRTDSARTATGRESLGDITPAATLVEPMQTMNPYTGQGGLGLEDIEADAEVLPEQPQEKTDKKTKPRRNRKNRKAAEADPAATPAKDTAKGKPGWRQTPLLEPNPSFQPFSTLNKKNGRRNARVEESGWATEEATDVQEMGDFDFAGGLAKFDKHTVFNQIQAEDSVADEDRLVAHNRLPKAKPGTSGGKNLHYTENVLETPNGAGRSVWKSEAGESDREGKTSQRGSGSGRHSRRGESRLSIHHTRPTSRKGSAVQAGRNHSVAPAALLPAFFCGDLRCESISPMQMLNLENIAENELGLTDDMMSELAGHGIARVALSVLGTPGRAMQGKKPGATTVVILAGNNKSAVRAIAAGRHLMNNGLQVVVCLLGLERESELLVGLRHQVKVFRNFAGKVVGAEYIQKSLRAHVGLIIDGLLGVSMSFEELRPGEEADTYQLIQWANRSKAEVLAIDVPTGIEPTNGTVSITDSGPLHIHANHIVAMAAPKKGLVEAMTLAEGVLDDESIANTTRWQTFVVDIGLGAAAWKKAGTKIRRGPEFEGKSFLKMRFVGVGQ